MNEPTRRPLTKEAYKAALIQKTKRELLVFMLTSLLYSLIFCLLALCLYFLLRPFSFAWAIFTLVLFLLPPVAIYCHEIGRAIYHVILIKQDKLTLIQDTLTNISIQDCIRHPMESLRIGRVTSSLWLGHIQFLHFSQNHRDILDPIEQYDASFCGDTFYIVMYNNGRNRPALVYNTKIYELKKS